MKLLSHESNKKLFGRLASVKGRSFERTLDPFLLDKDATIRASLGGAFTRIFTVRYERMLDIGCGTGFYFPLLMRHCSRLDGLDVSVEMLAEAERLIERKGLKGIHLQTGTTETVPFPDETFDAVFCMDTLHHVEDIGKTVSEIGRVLKSGGLFAAIEPSVFNPLMGIMQLVEVREWGSFTRNRYLVARAFRERRFDVAVEPANLRTRAASPLSKRVLDVNDWLTSRRGLDFFSSRFVLRAVKSLEPVS